MDATETKRSCGARNLGRLGIISHAQRGHGSSHEKTNLEMTIGLFRSARKLSQQHRKLAQGIWLAALVVNSSENAGAGGTHTTELQRGKSFGFLFSSSKAASKGVAIELIVLFHR